MAEQVTKSQVATAWGKLHRIMAQNNAIASRDPVFAAKLAAVRRPELYRRVAGLTSSALRNDGSKEVQIQNLPASNLSGLGGEWALAAAVIAVSVAAIALSGIYLLTRIESRVQAERNPTMSVLSSMQNMAIVGLIGMGIIFGGLIYWDRKYGGSSSSGKREAEKRPYQAFLGQRGHRGE